MKAHLIVDGTLLPSDRLAADRPFCSGKHKKHGIIDALTKAGINCWADKGYQGAGGTVCNPYRGRWNSLSAGQKEVNRSHAKIRALVGQAVATLKSWRLLCRL